MTKSELIARLAEQKPNLYYRDVERIVSCFLIPSAMRSLKVSAWNYEALAHFRARTPRQTRTQPTHRRSRQSG